MAKINFCAKTADLRSKANDGRHDQARREAIGLLREGYAAKPFLAFVAELLEEKKQGRGRPSKPPMRWHEIGEEFEQLRDEGMGYEETLVRLAKKFGASESTIRRAHEIYEEASESSR